MSAMNRRTLLQSLPAFTLLTKVTSAQPHGYETLEDNKSASKPLQNSVYELRIYHAVEGKLPELLARFRDHTTKLFEKHGIRNVAYWTPMDDPQKGKTLIYIVAHPSREAAAKNWQAFREDPEWVAVRDKSEANGKIVESVDSTYMALTDFSSTV